MCQTNTANNTYCSYNNAMSGPLFKSYCLNINATYCGGLKSLDLTAYSSENSVSIYNVTYITNKASIYQACYWHISTEQLTWKSGKIAIKVSDYTNGSAYIFGGNSRSNASRAINVANNTNASLANGQTYYADVSTDLMIMFLPTLNA